MNIFIKNYIYVVMYYFNILVYVFFFLSLVFLGDIEFYVDFVVLFYLKYVVIFIF